MQMPRADGYKIAAFVEQELDSRIHPFADGCGRTSKIVSGWILARYDLSLPQWESRDEYYEHIEKDLPEWEKYYLAHIKAAYARGIVDAEIASGLRAARRPAVTESEVWANGLPFLDDVCR
jgi:hypothetical protein